MSASAEVQSQSTNPKSRRALLAAAIGGLAAWIASAAGRASPVQAADNDPMLVGNGHEASSMTQISKDASLNEWAFSAINQSGDALHGESHTGSGVLGVSVASGGNKAGVYGVGVTFGGQFDGGKAQLKLVPKGTAGKPTSGTHTRGEVYMDSRGALYLCSAGGTPGTWRKVVTKLA